MSAPPALTRSPKPLSFQETVFKLKQYWSDRSCIITEPYDVEVGAGTMAPETFLRVIGTKPLTKIEVLKDSEVVQTFQPGRAEYQGRWTDPKPAKGVHWYYVRVQQEDGALAWASPLYIDFAP